MKETMVAYPAPKQVEPDKVFEIVDGSDLVYVVPRYTGIYFSVYRNKVNPRGGNPLNQDVQNHVPSIDSSRYQFFYVYSKNQLVLLDVYDHEDRRFLQPEEFSTFLIPENIVVPRWEKRPAAEVFSDVSAILKRYVDGADVKIYRDGLVVFSIIPQPQSTRLEREKE
ncbi:MAG: hypothetical protein QXG52_08885 [Candidatus Caldarchaeum sp.]